MTSSTAVVSALLQLALQGCAEYLAGGSGQQAAARPRWPTGVALAARSMRTLDSPETARLPDVEDNATTL